MNRILVLVLLLSSAGCSLSYQHGQVSLGQSLASVQASLGDLRQPSRVEGKGLKLEEGSWVRIPEDDPEVVFEVYTFSGGELSSIHVAYAPEADLAGLSQQLEGKLGRPDVKILGISYFEKEGGRAIFGEFDKPQAQAFYFEGEEEEEAVDTVYAASLMVLRETSYRFAFFGACLPFIFVSIGGVFMIQRELNRVHQSTPAITNRANLNAYRRLGYRHKFVDAAASVLLLVAAGIAITGLGAEELKGLDIFLLVLLFTAYAAAGKSYSLLGKNITKTVRAEDPELQEPWDAWLQVMNTPFALSKAQALAKEAGA